jgi:hypothetical protein
MHGSSVQGLGFRAPAVGLIDLFFQQMHNLHVLIHEALNLHIRLLTVETANVHVYRETHALRALFPGFDFSVGISMRAAWFHMVLDL